MVLWWTFVLLYSINLVISTPHEWCDHQIFSFAWSFLSLYVLHTTSRWLAELRSFCWDMTLCNLNLKMEAGSPPSTPSRNVVSHVINNTSLTSQRLTIIITVASLILCNVLVVLFRAMDDAELMIRLFPKHTKSYYRKGEILAALKVSCLHVTVCKNSSLCHWYLLLDDSLPDIEAVNSDRLWKMVEVF